MSGVCTLYRGGLQPATLGCGGKLPWWLSGVMDRPQLVAYLRFCPQCGRKIRVSEKASNPQHHLPGDKETT